jgi:hypothetical protein
MTKARKNHKECKNYSKYILTKIGLNCFFHEACFLIAQN